MTKRDMVDRNHCIWKILVRLFWVTAYLHMKMSVEDAQFLIFTLCSRYLTPGLLFFKNLFSSLVKIYLYLGMHAAFCTVHLCAKH